MKTLCLVVTITTTVLLMIACGLYQSKVQKLQALIKEQAATVRQTDTALVEANTMLNSYHKQIQQATAVIADANQQLIQMMETQNRLGVALGDCIVKHDR